MKAQLFRGLADSSRLSVLEELRSGPATVSDLVAAQADPAHAVIGLRNHGITVTGETLTEILDRIEPRVIRQIPMS